MARCSCGELRATQSAGAVRTPLQEHQPPCVIRNGDPAHAWCIRLRRRGVTGLRRRGFRRRGGTGRLRGGDLPGCVAKHGDLVRGGVCRA